MNYLLDTHTVLWFGENSPRLSKVAKDAILDNKYQKYVSIASAWELAIKISLSKFKIDGGIADFFKMIEHNGFILKPIKSKHLVVAETLPFIHRDPFDRILIYTALSEGLTLISADENIHKYPVSYIW